MKCTSSSGATDKVGADGQAGIARTSSSPASRCCPIHENRVQAFSHWTYAATEGILMVTDVQGAKDHDERKVGRENVRVAVLASDVQYVFTCYRH